MVFTLLSGTSHPLLAQLISERLGVPLMRAHCYNSTSRESNVEIHESVRGKDVYIIQSGTKNVNNDIMELLILAYACRTASARRVVGVVPYLPYCKQSKMRKRGSVVCKLLAKMLHKGGINHLITMDLHQKEIQGFFDIPVDNLRASPFLLEYIEAAVPDFRNAVMVARNPNAVKRATSYAERLGIAIAVIHGERGERESEIERDDGRNSPPLEVGSPTTTTRMFLPAPAVPAVPEKNKPPIHVVGDVNGKIAIIIDDIVDDVDSFVTCASLLKSRGAYKVYVIATHGLLSADAPSVLADSLIDEVVVTNTVPHDLQKMQCSKIKTVDVTPILSEAIRRIHYGESMSHLFRNISTQD